MCQTSEARRRAAGKAKAPLHITIDGTCYDCTEFASRHPGGTVLNFYHGLDASEAFRAFHFSRKPEIMLKSLPVIKPAGESLPPVPCALQHCDSSWFHLVGKRSLLLPGRPPGVSLACPGLRFLRRMSAASVRPALSPLCFPDPFSPVVRRGAAASDKAVLAEFRAMTDSWRARGLYKPDTAFWAVWCTAIVGLCALGLWVGGVVGGIILGVGWAHCGFVQHHAGHMGYLRLQTLFECLIKGGSARWWRNRHTKHHAFPNVPGVPSCTALRPQTRTRASQQEASVSSCSCRSPFLRNCSVMAEAFLRRGTSRCLQGRTVTSGPLRSSPGIWSSQSAPRAPPLATGMSHPAHRPFQCRSSARPALRAERFPPHPPPLYTSGRKCPSACLRVQHVAFLPLLALYVPIFFVTTKKYIAHRSGPENSLSPIHAEVLCDASSSAPCSSG